MVIEELRRSQFITVAKNRDDSTREIFRLGEPSFGKNRDIIKFPVLGLKFYKDSEWKDNSISETSLIPVGRILNRKLDSFSDNTICSYKFFYKRNVLFLAISDKFFSTFGIFKEFGGNQADYEIIDEHKTTLSLKKFKKEDKQKEMVVEACDIIRLPLEDTNFEVTGNHKTLKNGVFLVEVIPTSEKHDYCNSDLLNKKVLFRPYHLSESIFNKKVDWTGGVWKEEKTGYLYLPLLSDRFLYPSLLEKFERYSKDMDTKSEKTKSKNNKEAIGGSKMEMKLDINAMIQVKALDKILGNDKISNGKLMQMSMVIESTGGKLTDLAKTKIMAKFFSEKEEDMEVEKLMLFKQLNEGRFDPTEIMQFRMMNSMYESLGDILDEKK